jgi:hypothetical protein
MAFVPADRQLVENAFAALAEGDTISWRWRMRNDVDSLE